MFKATESLFFFEDIRIYRDHKNMTNRLNNCEQANVEKTVATSNMLINDINYIKENEAFDLLDDKLKVSCEYRIKYPESSLLELSKIISLETGSNVSKSCLNHRFRKIKEFANKLKSQN